jgi:hypothetical protein
MEPEGSLPHLQQPVTCTYREPDRSSPYPPPPPTSRRSILHNVSRSVKLMATAWKDSLRSASWPVQFTVYPRLYANMTHARTHTHTHTLGVQTQLPNRHTQPLFSETGHHACVHMRPCKLVQTCGRFRITWYFDLLSQSYVIRHVDHEDRGTQFLRQNPIRVHNVCSRHENSSHTAQFNTSTKKIFMNEPPHPNTSVKWLGYGLTNRRIEFDYR